MALQAEGARFEITRIMTMCNTEVGIRLFLHQMRLGEFTSCLARRAIYA